MDERRKIEDVERLLQAQREGRDELMGVGEAAEFLGMSEATVRSYCDKGYLPHFRLPSRYRMILRSDLVKFMARRKYGEEM